MANRAIIAGASGLIGSNLLNILLYKPGYDEVLILVRKELPIRHEKLIQRVVDFSKLHEDAGAITGHAIFCCLGTTRKKTPDLMDYRKIDHDYPVKLAQMGMANAVRQYHLVSSIGANASSSAFYTKIKGEAEVDIIEIGLPSLHIYQPSILVGDRNEHRPMEKFATAAMKIIDPFLLGSLKKYRSINAATVANTMYKQSLKNQEGLFVYPSDKIEQLS